MSVITTPPRSPATEPSSPAPQAPLAAPPWLERPPRHRLLKALDGCLLVVLAAAGATVTAVTLQVHQIVSALNQQQAVAIAPGQLAPTGFGGAQTLLLVGNDQRKHTTTTAVLPHSNEMLLVRLDPSSPWISMMSIPRELEATINCPAPIGRVTTRFNYALTCGGFTTLVGTIKRVLGLSINHVVMIDFNNFKRAVDEMGCVYGTIDRRYYHVNTPYSEQYQEVNLQPGYQDMCGTQALQFVSYRHGDTSLVRDARDQSFLLAVKQQYGPTLIDNERKFEQIFGQTVQTDSSLHTDTGVLNLLGTLISSAGRPVRQVRFQATILPAYATPCACVTATPQQIAASVHSFLYGKLATDHHGVAQLAQTVKRAHNLPLTASPAIELNQALLASTKLPFRLEFPRVQDASGAFGGIYLRDYRIHAPGGQAFPIYTAVFYAGQLGQYYDVQGSTWTTAPLFDNPGQSVRVGGRDYYLYYEGRHINVIAWYEHGAVYWIHNTLLDSIGNAELLAIAEQTTPVNQAAAAGTPRVNRAVMHPPVLLAPTPASASGATRRLLGRLGAILSLALLPLLAIPLIRRHRHHAALRSHLRESGARIAQLQATADGLSGSAGAEPAPIQLTVARYRALSTRSALLALGVIALAGGAVAAGVLLLRPDRVAAKPPTHRAQVRPDLPTVPVAVLNATQTANAAKKLATQLEAEKVKVVAIGNVTESQPGALTILYAPGVRAQAAELAKLLSSRTPSVAAIDPVAQAAAGPASKLVVVIG